MAVTQPNISIVLAKNADCTGITLTDTTGIYNSVTNTGGYGLPGGPGVNDVTQVVAILTYNTLSNTITYTFTVASGVITAATITIASGTPTSILSSLPSTAWPFTDPFDLTGDYGVTIPTFEDDIFSVSYTISGTVSLEGFSYEAIKNLSVDCQTRCCLKKKWIDVDPSCECSSDKFNDATYLEGLLNQAAYFAEYGNKDAAVTALNTAKAMCDDNNCSC